MRVTLVDYDDDLFDITPSTRQQMHDALARVGATLEIDQRRTSEAVLHMAADADLVMVQSVRPLLDAEMIPKLARCRGMIRLGLGYDSIDVAAATAAGIPVSNVVDWCTDEVAELAVAHLMAGARRLLPLYGRLRQGAWEREAAVPTYRVSGKTAGVVGLGRTGRATAGRLRGLGLTVIACDPWLDAEAVAHCGAEKVSLDELLARADFCTLHVPLTSETHHLLDAEAFARMKDGVFVINTSRGAVIDEAALVEALRSGKVRGAGLDVMEQEPLPLDSPLREMDNVTLTPHVASYSVESVATLYRYGAEIAARLVTGEWVDTIVNPEVRAQAEARWGAYA